MFIYWSLFLVLAVGAFLSRGQESRRLRLPLILFVGLPTALMIGLRWRIGPDWPAYASIYKISGLGSFSTLAGRDDPGFRILCWSLQQVHAPFWVLNTICGTIFVTGLLMFCRRQPNPWLAYLVAFPYLVIVVAMSGDRQSIALGCLFVALLLFEDGKLYRSLALVLFGGLFHASVLLMLPLLLLSYAQNGLQRTSLFVLLLVLGVHFFNDTFATYARRYSAENIQSAGVMYRLAMNTLAALVYLGWRGWFDLDERSAKLWLNVSFCTLGLVASLALIPSSTAIDRFLLYLFPLQFVVFGRLPRAFAGDRQLATVLTVGVIGYAAAVQATFLTYGAFSRFYVPYRSIFDR